jgi:DNA polymerase
MSGTPETQLSGSELSEAVLARLRFERGMGIDFVKPGAFTPKAPATAIPAVSTKPQPAAQTSAPAKPQALVNVPAGPAISPQDKEARWKALEAKAMACQQCVLHKTRTNVVFGTGDRNAKLVFVGEGPGADEDIQGEPFVGRAGQLLNKIIGAMGLKREEVYICNVVKCRPPENRTPLPDEIGACSPFLLEQIDLVSPKAIVALGAPATKTLLNVTQGIMAMRGKWFAFRGIPLMPTFHPAFLLRQYTEENRRAVWEDMKKVMEKLKQE